MPTEKEKMIYGEMYDASDFELVRARNRAQEKKIPYKSWFDSRLRI